VLEVMVSKVWVVFFTGRAAGGVRGVVLEVLVRKVWAVFLRSKGPKYV